MRTAWTVLYNTVSIWAKITKQLISSQNVGMHAKVNCEVRFSLRCEPRVSPV